MSNHHRCDDTRMISGYVTFRVYEASRLLPMGIFDRQRSTYVKLKGAGRKSRTRAATLGSVRTCPVWSEQEHNTLTLPIANVMSESVSVEVWQARQWGKNHKREALSIPLRAYAHHSIGIPRWHTLTSQGSILFSVAFAVSEDSTEALAALDPHVHVLDPTTMRDNNSLDSLYRARTAAPRNEDTTTSMEYDEMEKEKDHDQDDALVFGDVIALHALDRRWLKFGSCTRSHFQPSKKQLQLTTTLNSSACFRLVGSAAGTPVTYSSSFHLQEVASGKRIVGEAAFFQFQPTEQDLGVGARDRLSSSPSPVSTAVALTEHGRSIITLGTPVYLAGIYPHDGGTHALGQAGESHHLLDPTLYVSRHAAKVTFTPTRRDGTITFPSLLPLPGSLSLTLTTYNVWMMPDKITLFANVSPAKCERAQLIPAALPPSDVVVFNEAFCHVARPLLLEAMKRHGYLYETGVVGHCVGNVAGKLLDGGVVLVSKFPIERTAVLRFGNVCVGDDQFADKGVMYTRVRKHGRAIHVFATHTQAWNDAAAVATRQDQFRMLRHFINEQGIPSDEPVVMAGDFNVNALLPTDEFDTMVALLQGAVPSEATVAEDGSLLASFNAMQNPLAASGPSSDGVNERLDFIMTDTMHLAPLTASVAIIPIQASEPWHWVSKKASFTDLSDHYPCTGTFTFDYTNTEEMSHGVE